jgi:hypothetical protein
MGIRKSGALFVGLVLLGSLGRALAADEAPKPADPGTLIVIDSAGKEQKLKTWKFTQGTRRLGWLTPGEKEEPAKDEKKEEPRGKKDRVGGPEALLMREETGTNWKDGVNTLIPLSHIKSITFDNDKQTIAVRVATGPKADDEVTLTGTTEWADSNRLTIEAEVDKGDLGVAEVVYKGGVAKGIKSIRFPEPKVEAAPAGRPAQFTVADKKAKSNFKVLDVQALYRTEGGEKALRMLMFKKTVKIEFAKINKLNGADAIGSLDDPVWGVTLKDGTEENFTLLRKPTIDGKGMQLEGLLAVVPGGYKLIPVHAMYELDFSAKADADEKKDK